MVETIYKETIFSKGVTAILGVGTVITFSVFVYQYRSGPGVPPEAIPTLVGFVILFVATLNFRKLTIELDQEGITAGYGIFKNTIPWENVEEVYLDDTSTVRYGGWGLRISRVEGTWRLIYNVMSGSTIVVESAGGLFGEFAFSTKQPEKVSDLIRQNKQGDGS